MVRLCRWSIAHSGNVPRDLGEILARFIDRFSDLSHGLPGEFDAFFGVVLDVELDEEVSPAHYPDANAPGLLRHDLDFVEGILVHVDDVVQHVDGCLCGVFEFFEVQFSLSVVCSDFGHPGQVD